MATGHFPNCSHNFAWRGVINHDRMITLTLQTKYDATLPSGYPKFAYPLEISFWIRNLFTHGQTLPGRFAIGSETIGCRFGVVYRDVITGSRQLRVHHFDAPSFTEFWNPEQCIFHSDGERRQGRCRRPWLSGIEGTMVLFAILRAPHDAAYWGGIVNG